MHACCEAHSLDNFNSQAPRICPGYQVGTCNITIYTSNHESIIHQLGPIEYTQEDVHEQELIPMEFRNGFILGEHYGISVTAESSGFLRSRTTVFGN
jgi:hypothetical protein